jgi:AcrR family transcriptional regulator
VDARAPAPIAPATRAADPGRDRRRGAEGARRRRARPAHDALRGIDPEHSAAALYWHVGSKDGLLDLIFDRVIGEVPVPDPDPDNWQEQVKQLARGERATILAHRDIIRLSIGRIPMGPNALRYADRVLAILRAGGVPDELAVAGQQLLLSVVIGFAIDESGEGGQPPANQPAPHEAAVMARDYLASLPAERFPHLVHLADHFANDDPDERFELLLDLFVDGLAQRVHS